jgi:NodT family efflux transporter outer membrane factor (OMF) lipoprotein
MPSTPPSPGRRRPAPARVALRAGLAAVAAGALVAACGVGPRYRRPDVPPPSAWVESDSAGAPDWPAGGWWHGFGSTDLDALIDEARRGNDDLGAAIARVHEADAQLRIAGAPLLPSVGVGATAVRERAPVSGVGVETYNQFSPVATASYELDFWGKNRAGRAAAKATAAASRYDRDTVELTVLAGVASAYFQVLELSDRIAIADANYASAGQVLRGLRRERDAGTATALDVAQQETVVATLNAAIPPLRQQRRQAQDGLAILLGRLPESIAAPQGGLDALSAPAVTPGLPSELLARRPDVASAEAQLIAANANVAVARAAFFPSISLTGSDGFASSALATVLDPASRIWSAAAGLTQPIFEGGALRGRSEYAKARYAELLSGYHKAVISAFGNVEDALSAVQQTTVQLERQQVAVDQARRAYAIAEAELRAGTINVLTLLNTETALFAARDALAQVKFARLQASLDLYAALGGGWMQSERATARSP